IVTERAHESRMSRTQSLPLWLSGSVYVVCYVALAWLSIATSSAPFGIVAWSPETGLIFAAFLIFGKRFWPWLLVAVAVSNLVLRGGMLPPIYHLLSPIVVGGGYAVALAWVQSSQWQFDIKLSTLRDILILVATAIFSSVIVAIASVLLLAAAGVLARED